MDITEVRIRLVRNREDRLRAFCSMTVDSQFVVRDIKVIQGPAGLFVAMPSRKISCRCRNCGEKNHLRASYCNGCGTRLSRNRTRDKSKKRAKFHADIAHPIRTECRDRIQERIIKAFQEEMERSKQPGYRPIDLDDSDD